MPKANSPKAPPPAKTPSALRDRWDGPAFWVAIVGTATMVGTLLAVLGFGIWLGNIQSDVNNLGDEIDGLKAQLQAYITQPPQPGPTTTPTSEGPFGGTQLYPGTAGIIADELAGRDMACTEANGKEKRTVPYDPQRPVVSIVADLKEEIPCGSTVHISRRLEDGSTVGQDAVVADTFPTPSDFIPNSPTSLIANASRSLAQVLHMEGFTSVILEIIEQPVE